jgi:hypothetical protein
MRTLFTSMMPVLLVAGLSCQNGTAAQQVQQQPAPAAKPAKPVGVNVDSLLAPIALYPDPLLAQMFLCAGDPAKVVEFDKWLKANSKLTGTDLQDAATVAGFDASFVAMALFPKIVSFMAEQNDWTSQLGKAFQWDKSAVFDSIQRLRKNAQDAGALKTTPQQEVTTKTTSAGEQVIVIEPANPQIVYVPQYNPQVVYTSPPPTTVVVQEDDDDDEVIAGVIGFTAGIAMGAAMNNSYYYGPMGWYGGAYMYNDAWDDYYDHREDAREDWADHREDLAEERGERVEDRGERSGEAREQRTERTEARQAGSTERQQARQSNPQTQAQRDQARTQAQSAATQARESGSMNYEARGQRDPSQTQRDRSGTNSDAFSGYSSGKSERAASARGQQSRGTRGGGGSRSGGGGRGGGGGRRR